MEVLSQVLQDQTWQVSIKKCKIYKKFNQEMQDLQEIQVLQEMARYPKHT